MAPPPAVPPDVRPCCTAGTAVVSNRVCTCLCAVSHLVCFLFLWFIFFVAPLIRLQCPPSYGGSVGQHVV